MINLDNLSQIHELDKSDMSSSVNSLPEQIKQAWEEVTAQDIPKEFHDTKNVVVTGMGGSALGGRACQYLFSYHIRGPLEVVTGYHLPHYANHQTLVVVSSYSGNTEETLSALAEAHKRNARIYIIATGGKLAEYAKEHSIPSYIFDPIHNPSGQPRMSLGYSVTSLVALLSKSGFISVDHAQIQGAIENTQKFVDEYNVRVPKEKNFAKMLAAKLVNKSPVLISSEHLWGITHAIKNQFNENAKTFTSVFDLPEADHHLIEGLQFPRLSHEILHFIYFESKLYHPRVQKRYSITAEIIEKNRHQLSVYELQSKSKLDQSFELLVFGSFVGFYLSLLNDLDPAPIPWVDYLKEKLSN